MLGLVLDLVNHSHQSRLIQELVDLSPIVESDVDHTATTMLHSCEYYLTNDHLAKEGLHPAFKFTMEALPNDLFHLLF